MSVSWSMILIALLCISGSSYIRLTELPLELLDLICLEADPKTAWALLETCSLFHNRFSSHYHEKYHVANKHHTWLSLYKVYQFWKQADSETERKLTEYVLSTNLDFVLHWDSLINHGTFDPDKFMQYCILKKSDTKHHEVKYADKFEQWIHSFHSMIPLDLLRIVLEEHEVLSIDASDLYMLLMDGISSRKAALFLNYVTYSHSAMEGIVRQIFEHGHRTYLLINVIKFIELNNGITPRILNVLLSFSSKRQLLKCLTIIECHYNIQPSSEMIDLLLKEEFGEDCCKLFIKKFPNTRVQSNQWSKAFSLHFSLEFLVELLNHTQKGFISHDTFYGLPNDIPEDIYLSFLNRCVFLLRADDIVRAMQRKFATPIVKYMIRRCCRKMTDDQADLMRAAAQEHGYTSDVIELIDHKFA